MMKANECNEQTIEIPSNEYKHLKECKAQLMRTYGQQIVGLKSEMITAGISAIINNTINNISSPSNTLINRISVYLKNLIKNST